MWPHDADANHDYVRRTVETFTPAFLSARTGAGHPAPDPIFVVGLHRSGSTLVEQILSSHSQVEGLSELPDLIAVASRLAGSADRSRQGGDGEPLGVHYPAMLADVAPAVFADLGAEYLDRTRIHRKSDRPFFIDKLPNNFMQLGLIQLILPNAKIIDARRHPMACCFSGFKQNFARGAQYSYSLSDLGRYYRDYVALMGSLRQGCARSRASRAVRRHDPRSRDRNAAAARLLRIAVRARMPAVLRLQTSGADREFGTGAPTDLCGGGRSLALFRAMAGRAEGRACRYSA